MSGLPLGTGSLFSQDSNTGSCHSDVGGGVGLSMMQSIGGIKELDPSPEKPVSSARTPTERKRKRRNGPPGNNVVDAAATAGGGATGVPDPGGKGVKKINEYFPKHTPSSPVRTVPAGVVTSGTKSPLPFNANPGLYPQSPQAQYVSSPSSSQGPMATGDFTTLMQPPKLPAVTKGMQTDLTGQVCGLHITHYKKSRFYQYEEKIYCRTKSLILNLRLFMLAPFLCQGVCFEYTYYS
jgi:hypothetical protein